MDKLFNKTVKLIVCFFLFINLLGCSSRKNLAALDDVTYANKVTRGIHVVDYGESLYSISFRYGRDFRELAAINGLDKSYKVHRGQKIYLYNPKHKKITAKKNKEFSLVRTELNPNKSKVFEVSSKKDEVNQYVSAGEWIWPANGKVVVHFDSVDKVNKGIDIAIKTTSKIKASAAGIVVYRGTGLKGYGQIIIIKHSEEFLSAYAQNDQLLVKEGQKVKQGQEIAIIEQQNNARLHFEIRKRGKPVDPLTYLSAKS